MSTAASLGLHGELNLSESQQQQIRTHLDELLASPAFAGSRRRQAFLRYVVEETLAGRGSSVKETTIAIDVFGRGRDFDAQAASVVRVTGSEVRKRLVQAYASGLGQDIRIELPLGGYQPTFQFISAPAVALQPPDISPAIESHPTLKIRRVWIALAAALSIAAIGSLYLLGAFRSTSQLDLLWRPFIDKNRPVLISLVAPTLLKLNPFHQDKWLPLDPAKSIPNSELVELENSYVGTGGAMGAARFAEQLTTRKQKFDLKFGSDVTFADLKNSPAIMIGVSKLTQEMTRGDRFQLRMEPDGIMIVDSKQKDRVWALPRRHESDQRADGYSLITRLLHSDSGRPMLMIEGMDARNTQAAVEFLTSNDLFSQFSRSVSPDWVFKSFQVVLHNSIYGNSAGSFTIVASDVW